MCGIAGYLTQDALLLRPWDNVLTSMLDPLRPRGPDGEGRWCGRNAPWVIGLGHRRLAILDLTESAAQPMLRGPLALVFNGEIYNYLELRRELQSLGHEFVSHGDTEVLLAACQQWGEACLDRLNGMFAFAVWDVDRKTLFCARDRAGEKPFYYYHDGQCLVFASEIKGVLAFGPPIPRAPRWERVAEYLSKDYQTLPEETFFERIQELLPARKMTVRLEKNRLDLDIRPFWRPPSDPGSPPPPSPDELRDLFDDSVRIRLRSDVPVGTCLSGGIDSPSIAAAVVKLGRIGKAGAFRYQGVHAFSPHEGTDERPYVQRLAEHLEVKVSYVEVTGAGCRDELDDLVDRQEVPFLSPSIYAQRCVFRRARELGLKVMLDGQGADELFGGYDWAVWRAIAGIARRGDWFQAAREAYAFSGPRFPLRRLVTQALGAWCRDRRGELPDDLRAALRAAFDNVSLPGLLRYADRNSMSFGVEARLPFLDPRLIDAAARLRPEDVASGGQTKAFLRRTMEGRLLHEITRRKDKSAFDVPEALWARTALSEAIREAAEAPLWKMLDVPGKADLLKTAVGETEGQRYNRRSWKVLCVYRWHRRFFG